MSDAAIRIEGVGKAYAGHVAVRDLSLDLRPPTLDALGLLPTLVTLVERFEKT